MSVIIAFLLFAIVMLELIILGVLREQGKQFSNRTVNWTIDARGVDAHVLQERIVQAIRASRGHYDA